MLAGRELGCGHLKLFLRRIGDPIHGKNQKPFASVDRELSAGNSPCGDARAKLQIHFLAGDLMLCDLDQRGAVVDDERLGNQFADEGFPVRVRQGIAGYDLKRVYAIGKRATFESIEGVVDVLFEQFPVGFSLSSEVNRILQGILVVIRRFPRKCLSSRLCYLARWQRLFVFSSFAGRADGSAVRS